MHTCVFPHLKLNKIFSPDSRSFPNSRAPPTAPATRPTSSPLSHPRRTSTATTRRRPHHRLPPLPRQSYAIPTLTTATTDPRPPSTITAITFTPASLRTKPTTSARTPLFVRSATANDATSISSRTTSCPT